jgi:hypothetical protein
MSYEYTTISVMSGLGAALASNGDEPEDSPNANGGSTISLRWGDSEAADAADEQAAQEAPAWLLPTILVVGVGVGLLVIAWPFVKGGLTAYAVAPEEEKWEAAKRGAIAGGVASWAAGPIAALIPHEGAQRAIRRAAPVAAGYYVGHDDNDEGEDR